MQTFSNFTIDCTSDPGDTYIDNIDQHTKFGANWLKISRDMPFCVFSKMAAIAIVNFQKVLFRMPGDTYTA